MNAFNSCHGCLSLIRILQWLGISYLLTIWCHYLSLSLGIWGSQLWIISSTVQIKLYLNQLVGLIHYTLIMVSKWQICWWVGNSNSCNRDYLIWSSTWTLIPRVNIYHKLIGRTKYLRIFFVHVATHFHLKKFIIWFC